MSKLQRHYAFLTGLICFLTACGGSTVPSSETDVIGTILSETAPNNDFELPAGIDEEGNRPGFVPATVCENNSCPDVDDPETDADRAASSVPYSLYTRGRK